MPGLLGCGRAAWRQASHLVAVKGQPSTRSGVYSPYDSAVRVCDVPLLAFSLRASAPSAACAPEVWSPPESLVAVGDHFVKRARCLERVGSGARQAGWARHDSVRVADLLDDSVADDRSGAPPANDRRLLVVPTMVWYARDLGSVAGGRSDGHCFGLPAGGSLPDDPSPQVDSVARRAPVVCRDGHSADSFPAARFVAPAGGACPARSARGGGLPHDVHSAEPVWVVRRVADPLVPDSAWPRAGLGSADWADDLLARWRAE